MLLATQQVWLAVLNINLGDWVRFVPGKFESRIESEHVANLLSRVPEILLHFLLLILIATANMAATEAGDETQQDCGKYDSLMRHIQLGLGLGLV